MRTASAYVSKLKAEAKGRGYKIQDTNHRLVASNVYRGAAGCNAINYNEITYTTLVCPTQICVKIEDESTLNGGTPNRSGFITLNGGTPSNSGSLILNGGNP